MPHAPVWQFHGHAILFTIILIKSHFFMVGKPKKHRSSSGKPKKHRKKPKIHRNDPAGKKAIICVLLAGLDSCIDHVVTPIPRFATFENLVYIAQVYILDSCATTSPKTCLHKLEKFFTEGKSGKLKSVKITWSIYLKISHIWEDFVLSKKTNRLQI